VRDAFGQVEIAQLGNRHCLPIDRALLGWVKTFRHVTK
jgi:hypothetical protein